MCEKYEFALAGPLFNIFENGSEMDHCAFRCVYEWADYSNYISSNDQEQKELNDQLERSRRTRCDQLPDWLRGTSVFNWFATKAANIDLELSVDYNNDQVVCNFSISEFPEESLDVGVLAWDFHLFVKKWGLGQFMAPKEVHASIKNALAPTGQVRHYTLGELGDKIDKEEGEMWNCFYQKLETFLVHRPDGVSVEFRVEGKVLASFNLDTSIQKLQASLK